MPFRGSHPAKKQEQNLISSQLPREIIHSLPFIVTEIVCVSDKKEWNQRGFVAANAQGIFSVAKRERNVRLLRLLSFCLLFSFSLGDLGYGCSAIHRGWWAAILGSLKNGQQYFVPADMLDWLLPHWVSEKFYVVDMVLKGNDLVKEFTNMISSQKC